MKVKMLDHIALYMNDRDAAADLLLSGLGFHVIDRTDRYTLVGAGGRLGKLTLFDAPEGRTSAPGVLERIEIRVSDPEAAAGRLPAGTDPELRDGAVHFTGPEGLRFALVRGEGEFAEYDLAGAVLRSGDPDGSARGFVEMGFSSAGEPAAVEAGGYRLRLTGPAPERPECDQLYHLGCLVDSAEQHRKEAKEKGLEIQDWVEGPNTLAVFVRGPEDVSVEYVEHKPTFSLV
ncbi:hypothetical protein RxyAA322_06610 [Rubrobacter xylanophilus]|uniref:Glyoxalase/fosfomycin resistance/dioxygenase domain-containing protein n=1 Tax=Rubrobacter xylanophilus TaxID=49319 RepID=A0A510HKD4_9ACTN|nr:VOC family protein [Rubrobacter xylanophilus]BBL78807.1 hypothetical protein RxyAA322_06610 [Rubrobacter xylanophilus]